MALPVRVFGRYRLDRGTTAAIERDQAIAYKIIDFIAQFEDELVKVWNKPKFVLNSHYIITLDKITDAGLRERLVAHAGMAAQVTEWRVLGW